MSISFQSLADNWPSTIVARGQVERFSGGLLNPRTLANLDAINQGPPRGHMGRKVFYPVDSLIMWMESRSAAERAV